MRIAFATTQTVEGSTIIGRVFPLAKQLSHNHEVHILVLSSQHESSTSAGGLTIHSVGREPFIRTTHGKERYHGLRLVMNMIKTAWKAFRALKRISPDLTIIVKPLPTNIIATALFKCFSRSSAVVLDVDDFELTANHLTTFTQRLVIHWSERTAVRLSQKIITATPFLTDHFLSLKSSDQEVQMVPTGYSMPVKPVTTPGQTEPLILYVGSISIASGHRVDLLPAILQQLVSKFPQIKMLIAGSGDDRENLAASFKKNNLLQYVDWHNRFSETEIPQLVARAAVIVDPIDASTTQRAKSSFRVSVAAAYGMPVVTSNIGIRPLMLPRQLHERFFALPCDPISYAAKISGWLTTPITTDESKAMQLIAQDYTWENLANNYENIITAV